MNLVTVFVLDARDLRARFVGTVRGPDDERGLHAADGTFLPYDFLPPGADGIQGSVAPFVTVMDPRVEGLQAILPDLRPVELPPQLRGDFMPVRRVHLRSLRPDVPSTETRDAA